MSSFGFKIVKNLISTAENLFAYFKIICISTLLQLLQTESPGECQYRHEIMSEQTADQHVQEHLPLATKPSTR